MKTSFTISIYLFCTTLFVLSFVNMYSKEQLINLILKYAFLLMLINIVFICLLPDLTRSFDFRYGNVYKGLFLQKNALGKYAVLCFFMSAWALLFLKKNNFLNIITIFFSIICIILSKSSGAAFIFMISLVLLSLFKIGFPKKTIISIMMVSFLTVFYFILSPPKIIQYLLEDLLNRDLTYTGRVYIWDITKKAIMQRPFSGYGINAFWSSEYYKEVNSKYIAFNPTHSHDGFLDIILSVGIVGLLLYILWGLILLRMCMNLSKYNYSFALLCFGIYFLILLNNIMETDLIYPYSMFYPLQIIVFFLVSYLRKEENLLEKSI
ncbi:O-antigen ligase family protein [Priestia megaterium]|uniref:O-antigen ligase family protein n=1 Tax=Priestia megaterium TaxID=1404 RepID=UPI0014555E72|nr:O-antigen ligase family protein [Priestia megaterium]